MTGLSTRAWAWIAAAMAVVFLGAVWAAGSGPSAGAPAATGSVRLGPDPGQDVAGYLAGLPATLPAPGVSVPALVQFTRPLTPSEAAAAGSGTQTTTAVFRVPFDRVQTALRFEPVTGTGDPAAALGVARERAAHDAEADADDDADDGGGAATPEARAALAR
ncbi:hypothetical protein, partial [Pseudonocardia tropica]|uniref:hypothetical protein n=1 Tax=Pseudonocardia tropica TaxID=681289 RepID=UPI003CD0950E